MSYKLLQTVVDIFPSFVAVSVIFLKIHLVTHLLELLNSSIPGLGRCVVPQLLHLLPFVMSWAIPMCSTWCASFQDQGALENPWDPHSDERGVVNLELISL